MNENKQLYDEFIIFLENLGYHVEKTYYEKDEEYDSEYSSGLIDNNKFVLGFCTKGSGNTYLDEKFALDHAKCFDKWSKCPCNLSLPRTNEERDFVKQQIEFWSSDEGYQKSNSYNFDSWIKEYSK